MYSIEDNANWLAIQYQNTNVQTLMQQIGQLFDQYLVQVVVQYSTEFSLDTATGTWLDYVGYRLGVFERPALPTVAGDYFGYDSSGGTGFDQDSFVVDTEDTIPIDDNLFRAFLRAKAQQLITDCTPENIRNALLYVFEEVQVVDNQNMTITVYIYSSYDQDVIQALVDAGVITKPAAVRIIVELVPLEYFGFDTSGGTGFDQASFIYSFVSTPGGFNHGNT